VTTPAVGASGNISANIAAFGLTNASYRLTMHVGPHVAAGTSLAATVALTSDTADSFPSNNSHTVNDAGVLVATQADVAISLNATPNDGALAGGNLTYFITVLNNGPSDALNVAWNALLDSHLTFVSLNQTSGANFQLHLIAVGTTGTVAATIANLAAGSSATFQLVAFVTPSTPDLSNVTTSIALTSDTTDPGNSNNSDQIAVAVSNPPPSTQPGQFLVAFDPPTGRWFGSHLTNGTSQVLASFGANKGWRDGIVADFNGDGVSDLAARNGSGRWFVSFATPDQPSPYAVPKSFSLATKPTFDKVQAVDVNHDGKADILAHNKAASNTWYVFKTNAAATGFTRQSLNFAFTPKLVWTDFVVGDFTGDGRADVAARVNSAPNTRLVGNWYVSQANALGVLGTPKFWGKWDAIVRKDVQAADYNGDGKADIVGRDPATGTWRIAQSTGKKFVSRDLISWGADKQAKWHNVVIADLNDDGKDDIVGQNSQGYWFWIHQGGTAAKPTNLLGKKIGRWLPAESYKSVFAADVDHDGKDELIGRRGTNGVWRIDRLNEVNTKLTTDTAANHAPDWDESVDWMFASLGDDDQGLF
jgi:uncharacterized repeat protein (TIGR01451 family)